MYIRSLQLKDFRNYETCDIGFTPGIHILYGDNAQGKTNILESVFLAATTKSHRGSKDQEMIRFGKEESHIRSIWDKDGIEYRIDMHLRKQKSKGIAVNGQNLKRTSQLMGICSVVFFSPEDLSIVKEGPSERRRFMDMELCQIDASYLYHLNQYHKVLNQRNKMLRDYFPGGRSFASQNTGHFDQEQDFMDVLSVWDQQLLDYGRKIIQRRQSFLNDINDIMKDVHGEISGGKEKIMISYEPDTAADDFEENLKKSKERDIKYKTTNVGPHKDDVLFSINGIDVRKYGSQGQQRTTALSLKLSEIEMIKRIRHDSPVLLLDDVLSELDANRQNFLLDKIGDIQTIITCTGVDEFVSRRMKLDMVYRVENGKILL